MGATRSRNAAQETRWGTWALVVSMGVEKQEPKDANGFFKENEGLVTVLRTRERKQSKMMTVMFRGDTYYPFGAWHLQPFLPGESPNPCFLTKGGAPCLPEKLKEPDLISSSSWRPLFRCVTYLHQSDAPTWDSESQRVTRT